MEKKGLKINIKNIKSKAFNVVMVWLLVGFPWVMVYLEQLEEFDFIMIWYAGLVVGMNLDRIMCNDQSQD